MKKLLAHLHLLVVASMLLAVPRPCGSKVVGMMSLLGLAGAVPVPPRHQGHHAHAHGPGCGCAKQRGAVIYPSDLAGPGMVAQWARWVQEAGLNYVGLHGPAPEGVLPFLGSETQTAFAAAMAQAGVTTEYELHSFSYLLPRGPSSTRI